LSARSNVCFFVAFGKSDFYRRYKHAIANCYQVKTTGEMLPRPNTNDEQVLNLVKCPCFIDDVSVFSSTSEIDFDGEST
jgi:hypothetical protein